MAFDTPFSVAFLSGADALCAVGVGSERQKAEVLRAKQADDGLRTRDLQLGKLALYQLSYVRVKPRF
jgi:hypothetical protein